MRKQWPLNGAVNYKDMAVKYRNGYPTKSSIRQILNQFYAGDNYVPRISGAYEHNGSLIWERSAVNDKLDELVAYLKDAGVEVESYRKYESPTCGNITFKKKK